MIAPSLFCFRLEIKLVILHAPCRKEEDEKNTGNKNLMVHVTLSQAILMKNV